MPTKPKLTQKQKDAIRKAKQAEMDRKMKAAAKRHKKRKLS